MISSHTHTHTQNPLNSEGKQEGRPPPNQGCGVWDFKKSSLPNLEKDVHCCQWLSFLPPFEIRDNPFLPHKVRETRTELRSVNVLNSMDITE